MRLTGVSARDALAKLHPAIVKLEALHRTQLFEELRQWEIKRTTAGLKPAAADAADSEPDSAKVICAECRLVNPVDEIFCRNCGQLLLIDRGTQATKHFAHNGVPHDDEIFEPDMTLVLMLKGAQDAFRVRPQDLSHEVIVGRGAGMTLHPDIDLSAQQGALLGVSRLHLSISYNARMRTLTLSDLRSANGTYVNGTRLLPEEVRVLRHGDELRLGRLTLVVYFLRGTAGR
jgi:hypothetical protein